MVRGALVWCLLLVGCGDVSNPKVESKAEDARIAVAALGSARAGWMRTLGENARAPKIAEIRDGYDGELQIALEIKGKPSEKLLYFQYEDGELKFNGPTANPGPGAAATAVVVNRKFAIENFTSLTRTFSYGAETSCGILPNTNISGSSVSFPYYNCTEAGFGSCYVFFRGTYSYTCGAECGKCAGAHAHDGSTRCWWQWVGDDMWFVADSWHGYDNDVVCNP